MPVDGATYRKILLTWSSARACGNDQWIICVPTRSALSKRAGLSVKVGPHALRHYAATAILRRTGDLELVRRVLRHETLTMALRVR
jgi:integrase